MSEPKLVDQDIADAYHYMLARWIMLRQETVDRNGDCRWNQLIHRERYSLDSPNPNLDVAESEAWIHVDESSGTVVELPPIEGRYFSVQLINGWGEVSANINERNYPDHPFGKFVLCLKHSNVTVPPDAQRIDLPGCKSRLLVRIELGASPAQGIALQKRIAMQVIGSAKLAPSATKLAFSGDKLPGVEAFDETEAILASEPELNPGMETLQHKARTVAIAATNPKQHARIDDVIRKQAIPAFLEAVSNMRRVGNGWIRPRVAENNGYDFLMRSVAAFSGLSGIDQNEVVHFGATNLDGGQTYIQTYPSGAPPKSKAGYLWSVIALDVPNYRVIPNTLNRYLLNQHSPLEFSGDGSLTLAFAPKKPAGIAAPNWLPTRAGQIYSLTYRFYGPTEDVVIGKYFPPPLDERRQGSKK